MKILFTASKKYRRYISALSGVALGTMLFMQSCSESGTDPVAPYDYYPLAIGQFQIYQVNEDVYSSGSREPVSKTWQEKDEVIGLTQDSTGYKVYTVSRSTRNSASQAWQKIKEYSVKHDPDKVIVNLDNEVLMPLVFPYSAQIEWDGYRYFNLSDNDPRYGTKHHYENINKPLTINSLHFDKSIKVSERTDTSGVTQYYLGYKEYAAGVGLVTDVQTNLDYLQENGELIGDRVIGSGTRRSKTILQFGISE